MNPSPIITIKKGGDRKAKSIIKIFFIVYELIKGL